MVRHAMVPINNGQSALSRVFYLGSGILYRVFTVTRTQSTLIPVHWSCGKLDYKNFQSIAERVAINTPSNTYKHIVWPAKHAS